MRGGKGVHATRTSSDSANVSLFDSDALISQRIQIISSKDSPSKAVRGRVSRWDLRLWLVTFVKVKSGSKLKAAVFVIKSFSAN